MLLRCDSKLNTQVIYLADESSVPSLDPSSAMHAEV